MNTVSHFEYCGRIFCSSIEFNFEVEHKRYQRNNTSFKNKSQKFFFRILRASVTIIITIIIMIIIIFEFSAKQLVRFIFKCFFLKRELKQLLQFPRLFWYILMRNRIY